MVVRRVDLTHFHYLDIPELSNNAIVTVNDTFTYSNALETSKLKFISKRTYHSYYLASEKGTELKTKI